MYVSIMYYSLQNRDKLFVTYKFSKYYHNNQFNVFNELFDIFQSIHISLIRLVLSLQQKILKICNSTLNNR